jgi:hypothetical protein
MKNFVELQLHKRRVESVFSLLGEKENHITFSLGWAFSRSPHFLKFFLKKVLPSHVRFDINNLEVVLQEHKNNAGITDIEVRESNGKGVHVIIEAKRGWTLPNTKQLKKYVPRIKVEKKSAGLIVTMSECSEEFARERRLPSEVKGIAVKHVSWEEIGSWCQNSRGSHAEKRLMRELRNYLATIVNMQKQDSNKVYVVSLGNQECAPGLTFKRVVNGKKRYFHPYGRSGWPKEPPNYIGFRYDGVLQSIHHIERAELFNNFHLHFPEYADEEKKESYYLYHLGPAIRPSHEVKAGTIKRSLRVWATLDLLLTSKTISEARDKSKKRLGQI